MKDSLDALAIFGGAPLFATPRPIGQLDAPDVEDYLTRLKSAFDSRRLTNDGSILLELEDRLARFHAVSHCVAVANAGIGITMLLQLLANGRRGEIILPGFSYRGLPHFIRWAGLTPCFCDVEEATHGLDPTAVDAAISPATVAILGVCNCNSPGDLEGLGCVAAAHGIPLLFDSVYALGATYQGRRLGGFGCAEVYSLHATKLLNGFEGGYITTNDDALTAKLRWQRNFCLPGLRPDCVTHSDHILGTNAKLNELHAAMALLSLDRFEQIVARNRTRTQAYEAMCAGLPGIDLLPGAGGNFGLAIAEAKPPWPLGRDQTVALLRAEGMQISAYYSPPLHRSEHAQAGLAVPDLPVSEALAKRFFQLPAGNRVSLDDIAAMAGLLRFVSANGRAIAGRMSPGRVG